MTDSTSDDEEEEEDADDADDADEDDEAAEEEESKDDKAAAEDADQEDKDVDADTEADADDDDDDNKADEAAEGSAAADDKVDSEEAEEEEQNDEDDEDDEDDEESTRIAIKITRLAASVFITVASSFTDGECLVKARSILTKLFESELEDSFSPEDVTTAADTIKSKDSSESNKRLIIIFLCNLLKSESSAIDDEEATKTALRTTVIPILNIFNGDSDNLLFITSVIAFIDLLSQIWSDFGSAFVRAGFIETVVNALDCDDAEDISGVRRNSVEAELVGNCISALDSIAMKVYLPTARNEAILEAVLPFTTEPLNTQVSGRIFGYSARLRASAISEDLNDDDDDDGDDDDDDDDDNDDNEVSSSTLSAFPDSTLKRLMDMTFAKEEDAEEDPDDSPPTPRALRCLLLDLLCRSSQLVKRFIELGLVERLHTHIKTLIGDIPLPTASDEKAADKPEYDGSVWDSFDIELFKMYLSMLRPLLSCTPELFDKVASTGVLDTLSSITIGNKLDASVDIADNHSEASLTANRTLLYAIFSPKPRTKEQLESVINKYDVLNIATRLLLICGEDASYASENHHHFMLVLTNLHSIFETSSEFVSQFDASVVASVKFLQTYSHMHGRIIEKITGAVDLLKLLRDTEDTLAFSACHALLAQFYGEKTGDDDFVPVKIGLMVLHTKINTGKRVRDPNTPKYNI
ncbi:hypothetical protein GQ42DRAFT_165854 [Ramicandelaber brevisporus]|nr:hypothetical protein GQ42DRAFT_165854 [Ramicandelaber brevisporus]